MRLIDADALIERHCKDCASVQKEEPEGCEYCLVVREAKKAPTVDAVPVVRCRDCYYGKTWENRHGYTGFTCRLFCMDVDPGGFRSYGERRQGDGD